MITPPEKRISALVDAGVPLSFLEAFANPDALGDLRFMLRAPDSAYFHLPQILNTRDILADFEVTPIVDGSNGDTFYVLLSRGGVRRFVHFELEADEIYGDFGEDFRLMLADLLIGIYEFSEQDLQSLIGVGRLLGFERSEDLFNALHEADQRGARNTFESDNAWRASFIPGLVA